MAISRLKTYVLSTSIAAAVFASAAQAQLYVGGALLYNQFSEDDGFVEFSKKDFSDKDNGWSAYIGYGFTRNFAVELGYTDFGTFHGYVEQSEVTYKNKTDINSYDLSVKASYPVTGSFAVYGRLGHYRWDTQKIQDAYNNDELQEVYTRNFDRNDLFGGVGASLKLTSSWNITAEYRRYRYEEDKDNSIDSMRVGLRYDF